MPQFVIGGELVDLTDREFQGYLTQLVRLTRTQIWIRPKIRAEYYVNRWQSYANHPGLLRYILEASGDARLPQQGLMRRLAQGARQLESYLTPSKIHLFYNSFPDWLALLNRFARMMAGYIERFEDGGVRTVAALRLTRDTSFTLLRELALIAVSGPAGAIAATGRMGALRAVTGTVALDIAMRQTATEVRNLSRRLSGDPPSRAAQNQEIIDNALGGLRDGALGGLVSRLMRPITGALGPMVEQAISRNQLGEGLVLNEVKSRIDGAVGNAILQMAGSARREIRELLQEALRESSDDAAGRTAARRLIINRRFQRLVVQGLEDGR